MSASPRRAASKATVTLSASKAAWLIAPETHDRFARAISKTVGRVDDLFLQNNYRNDGAPP